MAVGDQVDWLELPNHLTVFIADKLSRCDFIRFSAVCKPWNSVYNAHSRHSLPRQLPLLLVPHTGCTYETYNTNTFYEFHEKRMYRLEFLMYRPMRYKGSSHGCLVVVKYRRQCKAVYVRILYPLLTDHKNIVLPPLEGPSKTSDIKKIVLSANPLSNHNYIVMAVMNSSFTYAVDQRLAFIKITAGDQADHWTYIDQSFALIRDIFYYNKNKQFYFVNDSGMVFACDLIDRKVLQIVAPPPDSSLSQHDNNLRPYLYLVELSSGELLLIQKLFDQMKNTIGFSAYKMNPLDETMWIEVQNLCGDSIFLSEYNSLSVRASDFCECKPNCIYYVYTDIEEWTTDANYIEVFNLEEGIIIDRYPQGVLRRASWPPIWIEPTVPRHC